jgi:hypothetical protein
MNFDISEQPQIVQQAYDLLVQLWVLAEGWLLSPAAWSQFALLLVAWFAARFANKRLQPFLKKWLSPEASTGYLDKARLFLRQFLPLLLPLLAYVFTGIGESVV